MLSRLLSFLLFLYFSSFFFVFLFLFFFFLWITPFEKKKKEVDNRPLVIFLFPLHPPHILFHLITESKQMLSFLRRDVINFKCFVRLRQRIFRIDFSIVKNDPFLHCNRYFNRPENLWIFFFCFGHVNPRFPAGVGEGRGEEVGKRVNPRERWSHAPEETQMKDNYKEMLFV